MYLVSCDLAVRLGMPHLKICLFVMPGRRDAAGALRLLKQSSSRRHLGADNSSSNLSRHSSSDLIEPQDQDHNHGEAWHPDVDVERPPLATPSPQGSKGGQPSAAAEEAAAAAAAAAGEGGGVGGVARVLLLKDLEEDEEEKFKQWLAEKVARVGQEEEEGGEGKGEEEQQQVGQKEQEEGWGSEGAGAGEGGVQGAGDGLEQQQQQVGGEGWVAGKGRRHRRSVEELRIGPDEFRSRLVMFAASMANPKATTDSSSSNNNTGGGGPEQQLQEQQGLPIVASATDAMAGIVVQPGFVARRASAADMLLSPVRSVGSSAGVTPVVPLSPRSSAGATAGVEVQPVGPWLLRKRQGSNSSSGTSSTVGSGTPATAVAAAAEGEGVMGLVEAAEVSWGGKLRKKKQQPQQRGQEQLWEGHGGTDGEGKVDTRLALGEEVAGASASAVAVVGGTGSVLEAVAAVLSALVDAAEAAAAAPEGGHVTTIASAAAGGGGGGGEAAVPADGEVEAVMDDLVASVINAVAGAEAAGSAANDAAAEQQETAGRAVPVAVADADELPGGGAEEEEGTTAAATANGMEAALAAVVHEVVSAAPAAFQSHGAAEEAREALPAAASGIEAAAAEAVVREIVSTALAAVLKGAAAATAAHVQEAGLDVHSSSPSAAGPGVPVIATEDGAAPAAPAAQEVVAAAELATVMDVPAPAAAPPAAPPAPPAAAAEAPAPPAAAEAQAAAAQAAAPPPPAEAQPAPAPAAEHVMELASGAMVAGGDAAAMATAMCTKENGGSTSSVVLAHADADAAAAVAAAVQRALAAIVTATATLPAVAPQDDTAGVAAAAAGGVEKADSAGASELDAGQSEVVGGMRRCKSSSYLPQQRDASPMIVTRVTLAATSPLMFPMLNQQQRQQLASAIAANNAAAASGRKGERGSDTALRVVSGWPSAIVPPGGVSPQALQALQPGHGSGSTVVPEAGAEVVVVEQQQQQGGGACTAGGGELGDAVAYAANETEQWQQQQPMLQPKLKRVCFSTSNLCEMQGSGVQGVMSPSSTAGGSPGVAGQGFAGKGFLRRRSSALSAALDKAQVGRSRLALSASTPVLQQLLKQQQRGVVAGAAGEGVGMMRQAISSDEIEVGSVGGEGKPQQQVREQQQEGMGGIAGEGGLAKSQQQQKQGQEQQQVGTPEVTTWGQLPMEMLTMVAAAPAAGGGYVAADSSDSSSGVVVSCNGGGSSVAAPPAALPLQLLLHKQQQASAESAAAAGVAVEEAISCEGAGMVQKQTQQQRPWLETGVDLVAGAARAAAPVGEVSSGGNACLLSQGTVSTRGHQGVTRNLLAIAAATGAATTTTAAAEAAAANVPRGQDMQAGGNSPPTATASGADVCEAVAGSAAAPSLNAAAAANPSGSAFGLAGGCDGGSVGGGVVSNASALPPRPLIHAATAPASLFSACAMAAAADDDEFVVAARPPAAAASLRGRPSPPKPGFDYSTLKIRCTPIKAPTPQLPVIEGDHSRVHHQQQQQQQPSAAATDGGDDCCGSSPCSSESSSGSSSDMADDEVLSLEVPAHVGVAEVLLGMGVEVDPAALAAARAKQLEMLRRRQRMRLQLMGEMKRPEADESASSSSVAAVVTGSEAGTAVGVIGGAGEVEGSGGEVLAVVNGGEGGGVFFDGSSKVGWNQCEQRRVSREFLLREEDHGVGAGDAGDRRLDSSAFVPTAAAVSAAAGATAAAASTAAEGVETIGVGDGDSEMVFSPGHFYRVTGRAETYAPSNVSMGSQISWAAWSTTSSISRCPDLQWWGKEGGYFTDKKKGKQRQRVGGGQGQQQQQQQQAGKWVVKLFKRGGGGRGGAVGGGNALGVGVVQGVEAAAQQQ